MVRGNRTREDPNTYYPWHIRHQTAFRGGSRGVVAVALNAGATLWPPHVNVFHANESHLTADEAEALAARLVELARQARETGEAVTA